MSERGSIIDAQITLREEKDKLGIIFDIEIDRELNSIALKELKRMEEMKYKPIIIKTPFIYTDGTPYYL